MAVDPQIFGVNAPFSEFIRRRGPLWLHIYLNIQIGSSRPSWTVIERPPSLIQLVKLASGPVADCLLNRSFQLLVMRLTNWTFAQQS